MTPVPLTLPFRPSEANELANLVFEFAERRPLTQEIRTRIAARVAVLKFETLRPYLGSLARDPVHHSSYYAAIDAADGSSYLLHMALSTAPTSSLFQKPLLIGRMRRAAGQEIVINAVPFGPADAELITKFTTLLDDALLPKAQIGRALVAPPTPAAFDAFRTVLKRTGRNVAALEMAASDFDAALYTAIRSGWREGYSAGVVIAAATADRETIRAAVRFTRFRVDTAGPAADKAAENSGESAPHYLLPALRACERLHEWIRQERAAARISRPFDFEAVLAVASARELLLCLDWLRTRAHPPQLVAPTAIPDDGFETTVRQMAAAAAQNSCQLTFDVGDGSPERLETIVRASSGKVVLRVTAGPTDTVDFSQYLIGIADILLG